MEGNNKAMREALSDACYAMFNFLKTQSGGYEEMANALDKAKAALAEPPRNCDVGTAEEQTERFDAFCQSNMQFYRDMFGHDDEGRLDGWDCREDCPVGRLIDSGTAVSDHCQLAWAQMPYEEGGKGK